MSSNMRMGRGVMLTVAISCTHSGCSHVCTHIHWSTLLIHFTFTPPFLPSLIHPLFHMSAYTTKPEEGEVGNKSSWLASLSPQWHGSPTYRMCHLKGMCPPPTLSPPTTTTPLPPHIQSKVMMGYTIPWDVQWTCWSAQHNHRLGGIQDKITSRCFLMYWDLICDTSF